ncbi:MAG: alpha-amylase family protein [Armatimonadia bacterium]
MKRYLSLITILLGVAAMAQSVPTVPPVTYILDYGGSHLGNEKWLQETIAAGPQLLHLGKDVVMTHNWGPIKALGGENQAYGKGDNVTRLTVAETRQRMKDLQAMTKALHDGGIPMVMPYICAMTIGGDPVKRTGFWDFYDHWDDYAADFKLGKRPAEDPETWFQVKPDGSPLFFYPLTDGKYPPYEPNLRYAVCMNNPGWRYWSEQVVRLAAEAGYDGVFVDNGGSQRCFCHYCEDKFAAWLSGRYTPQERQQYFGTSDVKQLQLIMPTSGKEMTPQERFRAVESYRFWGDTVRQHMLALKAAGEKVRKPFYIFPNGGHGRPEHVKAAFAPIDYVMYENSSGDFGTNPGLATKPIVANIKIINQNDSIYEDKLTQCVGGVVKPVILSRGGYPAERREWRMNPASAELGMAEMAAFSNGGGFMLRPTYGVFAEPLQKWRRFHETRASLYSGNVSYANVGVAFFPEHNLYGYPQHMRHIRTLTNVLTANRVLFDYVLEEQFTAEKLRKYALVIVPDVKYMSRAQVGALNDYLNRGGKVLIIAPEPVADEHMQPYDKSPLPASVPGKCVRRADLPYTSDLPKILDELQLQSLVLMPQEGAERVCVNATMRPDASRLYLHVVNYDVTLGDGAPPPTVKTGLQVRLTLPAGKQIAAARVYDPDRAEPMALAQPKSGALSLPPLRTYQVVELELR